MPPNSSNQSPVAKTRSQLNRRLPEGKKLPWPPFGSQWYAGCTTMIIGNSVKAGVSESIPSIPSSRRYLMTYTPREYRIRSIRHIQISSCRHIHTCWSCYRDGRIRRRGHRISRCRHTLRIHKNTTHRRPQTSATPHERLFAWQPHNIPGERSTRLFPRFCPHHRTTSCQFRCPF